MDRLFTEIHEYINYHVDKLFGNSVKYKFMASLNYMLTSHFGRMMTGALLVVIGLLIRGHYEKKMYYDANTMSLVQPTDFFYYVSFFLTFTGCIILAIYIIILFYNMIRNLFR